MEHILKIFDFNILNEPVTNDDETSSEDTKCHKDDNLFKIQMFGINEDSKTYSVIVDGFNPFFYVLVNDTWNKEKKNRFCDYIKKKNR